MSGVIDRHTNVPQYKGALGRWVKAQREHKKQTDLTNAGAVFPPGKKQPACLSPDRIAKLDSIGFQWKVNTIVGWENRYQQLLEYRRQHGDVHVPQAYPEDVAFVSLGDLLYLECFRFAFKDSKWSHPHLLIHCII